MLSPRPALLACALSLAVGPARAQQATPLSWSAPAGCPSAEVVQQRIERILNRPLAEASASLAVTAVVTAPSEAQPWSVTLESGSDAARASRTLQAASCDELANVTALFVAILLEPKLGEAPEPAAAPPPSPPPPPPALPARSTRPAAGPPAAELALGAAGGVRSGLVPMLAPGVGLHGAFSWKALRTSIAASYWLPVSETVDSARTQGAELQLSSASGELCWQLTPPPLVPALCGGAEVGLIRGRGFGPGVMPRTRTAWIGSLSAGAVVQMRLSRRLALLLDGDAVLPLGDRRFVLGGGDPAVIFEPGAGFRLTCGAEWSL